ncbi:MAG: alpha/beta hydrolase, partial [Gammaproteobacteria bacterium]|nr:alpha/beta hydrolase [Gammaproteobacteria bacterium]
MAETIDYRWLDEVGAGSIFFPRGDDRSAPQGAYDLLIPVDEGASVAARFYVHDPGAPSILYFHGNGEVAADHDDIAPLYGQIGVNLFVAEFRGYGQSGGSPTFAHLMGDASPTAAFVHEHLDAGNFSPARYLMGRSL